MDWIKSKTILILALLITNIILIYSVVDSQKAFDNKVGKESDSWEQVVKLAKEKGIEIREEERYYTPLLKGIRLEYQMYDPEQMAKNLLGEYQVILGKYENAMGDQMILENGNKLTLKRTPDKNVSANGKIDPNMAKIRAEQFLTDSQFSSSDMRLWNVLQSNQITTVIFRQYYNRLFLDDAYMAVTFENAQIVKFERKWFNPPEDLSYERQIIRPSKALFLAIDELLAKEEARPLTIKALELGYRLDSSSLVSSVKSGEASPYWRILTDGGQVFYIEAQQ